jgi:hypothetical protein
MSQIFGEMPGDCVAMTDHAVTRPCDDQGHTSGRGPWCARCHSGSDGDRRLDVRM